MESTTHWSFSFDVPGGLVMVVLLAIAFVAVTYWGVSATASFGPKKRRILRGLRVATALAAFVAATQPGFVGETNREVEGPLVVLVDQSRSLTIEEGGSPRVIAVRELLSHWDGARNDVSYFRLGDGAVAEDSRALQVSEPTEDRTRIIHSVGLLAGGTPGGETGSFFLPAGAVVVVSDGRDTDQAHPESFGTRVHTVVTGTDDLPDDSLLRITADPVGFLRQPGQVRVTVRSNRGLETIPVRLRVGDQVIDEATARFEDGEEAEVTLDFTPSRLGRQTYRVTIPVDAADQVPSNNQRAFLVRVTRDKLRVLLVAGQPSWDQRYLRTFLKEDPSIDLISFFILRSATDLTMASPDQLALIPFPTDELFSEHLGSFDLIFFQNFEFGPYQMAGYLPGIRDYVRRGGAFAMIGGELSFGSGGYAQTPIAEVLPVELPNAAAADSLLVEGEFRPRLVEATARHPLVRLADDDARNVEVWANLAPLVGANRVHRSKPSANVLLVHPIARDIAGEPLPILTTGSFGEGRVMTLAADTSYRWGITTAGETGDGSAYYRFWESALRWLTKDPSLDPARVTTDQESYGFGATVRIQGELRTDAYAPLVNDGSLSIGIEDSLSERVQEESLSLDANGEFQLTLPAPSVSGAYQVTVRDGTGEMICSESFLVESGGVELADSRSDSEFMRGLAEQNDGTFTRAEDLPDISDFDSTRTEFVGLTRVSPFAHWAVVLLLIGLFSLEWIMRRRLGQR